MKLIKAFSLSLLLVFFLFSNPTNAQDGLVTTVEELLTDAFERLDDATNRYMAARQNRDYRELQKANLKLRKASEDVEKLEKIREAFSKSDQNADRRQVLVPTESNRATYLGKTGSSHTNVVASLPGTLVNPAPTPRAQSKQLVLAKPLPADEGKYILELKPAFDLDNSTKKYRVITTAGSRTSKPIDVSIIRDKGNPGKPLPLQKIQAELFAGVNKIKVSVLDADNREVANLEDEIEIECEEPVRSPDGA